MLRTAQGIVLSDVSTVVGSGEPALVQQAAGGKPCHTLLWAGRTGATVRVGGFDFSVRSSTAVWIPAPEWFVAGAEGRIWSARFVAESCPAEWDIVASLVHTEFVAGVGVRPVGISSTRVEATDAEGRVTDYYLDDEVIGSPVLVGSSELSIEAVAALDPDLIVTSPAFAESVAELNQIAPVAEYDLNLAATWIEALPQIGIATANEQAAADVIESYEANIAEATEQLAGVVEVAPTLATTWPNFRGRGFNVLFDEQFAAVEVLPQLGFTLVGTELGAEIAPGVANISDELYAEVDGISDVVLSLGTVSWQEAPAAVIIETISQPVLDVILDAERPSSGPFTSPYYLELYVATLLDGVPT